MRYVTMVCGKAAFHSAPDLCMVATAKASHLRGCRALHATLHCWTLLAIVTWHARRRATACLAPALPADVEQQAAV